MSRAGTSGQRGAGIRALVLGVVLAAAALAVLVVAKRGRPASAGDCPPGFMEQPARAARLRQLMETSEEGRALVQALGEHGARFCFGAIEVPVVTSERALLLDRGADEREAAARAAHLLHHVLRSPPMPERVPADADCEAVVQTALEREASAYALELRLRQALGVTRERYAFEESYAREGEPAIVAYLVEHPGGGPGVDGLAAAYRQRCRLERAASEP